MSGQLQRALLEKRGRFVISDLLFSPYAEVLTQPWLKDLVTNSRCFWMTERRQLG